MDACDLCMRQLATCKIFLDWAWALTPSPPVHDRTASLTTLGYGLAAADLEIVEPKSLESPQLWDFLTGRLKKDLQFQADELFMMHDTAVLALAFSRDSELLASGSQDGKIKARLVPSP